MTSFKVADLVVKKHPQTGKHLQVGIIIKNQKGVLSIKWLWYNKNFFMEKEGDIFKELNNHHLLSTVHLKHEDANTILCRLSHNYLDVQYQDNQTAP
jgi:hypothetical protein